MGLADSGVTDHRNQAAALGRYAYMIQPSSRAMPFAACQTGARITLCQ